VKKTLPAAKSDVLSAFEFYGIPGGYAASYKEAIRLHNGISETWSRLKQTMASFDIPKDRVIKILEEQTTIAPGFDTYLENHLKRHQDLFVYSYLKSSASLGMIALEHSSTYETLRQFRPKIVLGKIVLPDGVDVSTIQPFIEFTKNSGVHIEKQSISLSSLTYQIVLFGTPGAQLDYRVQLGTLRSDVLSVDVWKSRFTKHRAVFTAALGVDLTLPPAVIVGQEIAISGTITPHAQSPDNEFDLSWTIDGEAAGSKQISDTDFTIPLVFDQAGRIDFEVTAVDKNGVTGAERTDIPVAFKMDTELQTSDAGELVVVVSIEGGSGEYSVGWLTDTGINISKNVGRNQFFQRFKEDNISKIGWIDLTVFDSKRQIEVPTRIFVEGSLPVAISLSTNTDTLEVGETMNAVALITDGLPDYQVVLYANGRELARRDTSKQSERFSLTFDTPATYQLKAVVTDADGGTAQSVTSITVAEPAVKQELETSEPASTFKGILDYQFYMVDPFSMSTVKQLVRQVVGSQLTMVIEGADISGTFTGEVWYGPSDLNAATFNCKVIGDYNSETAKIGAKLDCPGWLNDVTSPYSGFMSGTRIGEKLEGTWYFILNQAGGDWEATLQ